MSSRIVKKDASAKLTKVEEEVSKILAELEKSLVDSSDAANSQVVALREVLAKLKINEAREVSFPKGEAGRRAVLLYVPFPQLHDVRRIQKALVDELEKKLSSHVIIIANRTQVSAPTWSRSTKYSGVRPRSRTLKAVQEALLDDIAYPTEIVGKRLRVKADGSRLLRIHLNPKDQVSAESKVETFKAVFKVLTNKDVVFEFPSH